MRRRALRVVALFAASSLVVPFLPLYVERTMLRSWSVDHAGDTIEWGWRLSTLRGYWSEYVHMSPEQNPALWLGVNMALAFVYALLIALVGEWLITKLWRREEAKTRLE